MLFDASDVTQEYASRGMTAVYNLGDSETRHKLVGSLTALLRGDGGASRAKASDRPGGVMVAKPSRLVPWAGALVYRSGRLSL